ncbi:MAG: CoA-transferase, partial [Chloroflexota bacterium]
MGKYDSYTKGLFAIPEYEGESKVITLGGAIRRNVKPGMTVHMAQDARAAVCEIIRQFYGTKPGLTFVVNIMGQHALNVVHAGLARKLITSNASDLFPAPGPSAIIQRAFKEKTVEIESWSLLSLLQRFIAGALDVPFMPTKSLIGSSMAEHNKDAYSAVDDPFGSGGRVGVVKALQPDVSIVHGWAADPYGNTITLPVDGDGVWGAKAAKNPVIVTVERIVSTDFIREHAPLVKIPGHMVGAVCHVPFGAHPGGVLNRLLPAEFQAYTQDREFTIAHRNASQKPETLDAWLKEWVLDVKDHEGYLKKLGSDKLLWLRGRAQADSWEVELRSLADNISTSPDYNAAELMVVVAARQLVERMPQRGHRVVLTGIGTGGLAAFLAYYRLREKNYTIALTVGSGYFGFAPRPGSPAQSDFANSYTAQMLSDALDVYGVVVAGPKNASIGILGAGQIDKHGNINSTRLSADMYLTGAGGGNDAASTARECMVVVPQSKRRFMEQVPYISMPGRRVTVLVSNRGVFQKLGDSQELVLTHCLPD